MKILTSLWKLGFAPLIGIMAILSSLAFAQAPAEAVDQNPTTQASPTTGEEIPVPQADIPEEETPYPSRNARDNQLLAQASADEAQWLDTPEGEILALFRPTESRVTKGTLLLLHAAEMPPGWPTPLENLRRNLPQYGWQTLAITLPQAEGTIIPARELPIATVSETEEDDGNETTEASTTPEVSADTEDQSITADNTDGTSEPADEAPVTEAQPVSVISREELIAQRIQAALMFLAQNEANNIALLVDNSSINDSLEALVTQSQLPSIRALILTNIQPQEALNPAQLSAALLTPQLPVLDVFIGPNNEQQQAWSQRHRAQAMRNQLEIYHQFAVPSMQAIDINNAQSFWLERIRGFLERHVKNQEVL